MQAGERVEEATGGERASSRCRILRGRKSPDGGVPAQWCCCLN